jgi:hypothetical protein
VYTEKKKSHKQIHGNIPSQRLPLLQHLSPAKRHKNKDNNNLWSSFETTPISISKILVGSAICLTEEAMEDTEIFLLLLNFLK